MCRPMPPYITNSHSSEDRRPPLLTENNTYLANLFRHVLEEELTILPRYSQCVSTALALDGSDHWKVFLSD